MKYVCLLRGISVGGNNKVSMSDLKKVFSDLGFKNITTYINSGNVLFSSDEKNIIKLIDIIENKLANDIMPIKVTVISSDQLKNIIKKAPKNWGNDTNRKHNLLFLRPPTSTTEAMKLIGTTKPEYETVTEGQGVIYWSASLKDFGKTASSRLAGKPIYQEVTVRNYNTSIKLLKLLS